LLFLQSRYHPDTPAFMLTHMREHVRCLGHFFDVKVVSSDCDLDEICDRHGPDLVLFETGLEVPRSSRPKVRNLRAHRTVPRAALINADGCTEFRSAILADLDCWGVETAFTISTVLQDHTADIARETFVWPNFIDSDVFCDYGHDKTLPILITGSQNSRYPWRHAVFRKLASNFPALICPHPGYASQRQTGVMLHGESYARLLNRSYFVPTCGSVTNELVRKHLEIPGSRACLVAQPSSAVAAAGFVDMINCVLGDDTDIPDKINALLKDAERLQDIIDRGYELAHRRHTMAQRSQILQWLNLSRDRTEEQRIVQTDPFAPLVLVTAPTAAPKFCAPSSSKHLVELAAADIAYSKCDYLGAIAHYRNVLAYLSELPEAKFGLSRCELHLGRPDAALQWIVQPLRTSLARYGADEPDPVEWAQFVLCLLCLGRLRQAQRRARQFEQLRHPELDRVRSLVHLLDGTAVDSRREMEAPSVGVRRSVHRLTILAWADWLSSAAKLLQCSGRHELARRLVGPLSHEAGAGLQVASTARIAPRHRRILSSSSITLRATMRHKASLRGFDDPELGRKLLESLRQLGRRLTVWADAALHLPRGPTVGASESGRALSSFLARKAKGPLLQVFGSNDDAWQMMPAAKLAANSAPLLCLPLPSMLLDASSPTVPLVAKAFGASGSHPCAVRANFEAILSEAKSTTQSSSFSLVAVDLAAMGLLRQVERDLLLQEIHRADTLIFAGKEDCIDDMLRDWPAITFPHSRHDLKIAPSRACVALVRKAVVAERNPATHLPKTA